MARRHISDDHWGCLFRKWHYYSSEAIAIIFFVRSISRNNMIGWFIFRIPSNLVSRYLGDDVSIAHEDPSICTTAIFWAGLSLHRSDVRKGKLTAFDSIVHSGRTESLRKTWLLCGSFDPEKILITIRCAWLTFLPDKHFPFVQTFCRQSQNQPKMSEHQQSNTVVMKDASLLIAARAMTKLHKQIPRINYSVQFNESISKCERMENKISRNSAEVKRADTWHNRMTF